MCELSEERKRFRGGGTLWEYFEFFQPFFMMFLFSNYP